MISVLKDGDFTLVFVHKYDLYMHRCTFKYIYIKKRDVIRSIYGMHIQRRIHSYRGRNNMIERTRREDDIYVWVCVHKDPREACLEAFQNHN